MNCDWRQQHHGRAADDPDSRDQGSTRSRDCRLYQTEMQPVRSRRASYELSWSTWRIAAFLLVYE
jgi:hypothetical protein